MNLSDIVSVQISLLLSGLTLPGFGTGLILSNRAAWVAERVRTYSDMDGVSADWATTSPEYLAALAYFGQTPRPERLKIGKGNLKATQRWKVTIALVADSTTYSLKVGGIQADYTSDPTATNDEIVTGLVAAIGTVAGFGVTAAGTSGSLYVQILASAAGNWVGVENLQTMVGRLAVVQDHADPGVATDLAEINLVDSDWYGLITLYNSEALVEAAAPWVQANKKIYIPQVCDTVVETTLPSGAVDVVADLLTSGYTRTAALYKRSGQAFGDAAWFGARLPLDPGSETWAFASLAGVPVDNFTATQQQNILGKRGNIYTTVSGTTITWEGTCAASGMYIDIIRFTDWLEVNIQADVFLALKNRAKVPYTDEGIAVVENALRAVLDRGVEAGGIVGGSYTVTVPKAASASPTDKANRTLRGIKFKALLAGAIHKVRPIEGEIVF